MSYSTVRSSLVGLCRWTTNVAVLVPPTLTCHRFQVSMTHRLVAQPPSQKLVPSDANGSRATMFTTGRRLLSSTVIWIASETELAPPLSVAFARKRYSPGGTFDQVRT